MSLIAALPTPQDVPEGLSSLDRSRLADLKFALRALLGAERSQHLAFGPLPSEVISPRWDSLGADVSVFFELKGPAGVVLLRLERTETSHSGRTLMYGFRTLEGSCFLSSSDAVRILGL